MRNIAVRILVGEIANTPTGREDQDYAHMAPFRSRGVLHLDASPSTETTSSKLSYTASTRDGTINFPRRFWIPGKKDVKQSDLKIAFLNPLVLSSQSLISLSAIQAENNVLYRDEPATTVHAKAASRYFRKVPRVFFRDFVTAVGSQ